LCAVVADITGVDLEGEGEPLESNLTQNIMDYVDKYKVKYGVPSIVLNVKMRK